ncbi:MAG: hypothetical protein HRT69_13370 [Flavobacteriaceae bacterium]|nr:hypothetical protein [Flavobacteriaceae bacterium]|tara:strand:- start:169 stop:465 length:297 start_codon:yes stop_codon:yes gene_type:complete
METLELEQDFELGNTETNFTAHYNDYIITGQVECDVILEHEAEEEVGIMSDQYQLEGINFWYLEVKNHNEEIINLNNEELQSCKNEIENELNNLVEQF